MFGLHSVSEYLSRRLDGALSRALGSEPPTQAELAAVPMDEIVRARIAAGLAQLDLAEPSRERFTQRDLLRATLELQDAMAQFEYAMHKLNRVLANLEVPQ